MHCQLLLAALALGGSDEPAATQPQTTAILRSDDTRAALRYRFSAADEKLLDEIQHACFLYFWKEVGQPAQLAKDRLKAPVSSVAAVGFQLAGLPVGVERGWVKKEEARTRAATVLKALLAREDNKRFGVYLHYPDMNTAGLSHHGFEILAGTVDHALLLAGVLVAGEYFGGEVQTLAERMAADTDWSAFVHPDGWLSMGWRPDDPNNVPGPGKLSKSRWTWSSDEERLILFLAAGAPRAAHALPPEMYYRLKRPLGRHADLPEFVMSYPGTLFTYFFSHCYINYRDLEADDPARFGGDGPRVDWFENSRRAILTHRARCIAREDCRTRLGDNGWGLSACVGKEGYIVPEIAPHLARQERWYDCTIAPYAAGSAIMFAPAESLAALRAFRELQDEEGQLFAWRDPAEGGYGLVDAFCIVQNYASDDYVGIDQGPLLLAIENARTGLIWRLFMESDVAKRAVEKLRLQPAKPT